MADISKLSRLVNGVQRQVDLSTNTLVVDRVKFGGGAGTDLSKTILDRLISLQDGSDVDATYHTHDGRYFTEAELSDATGPATGSDLIGDDDSYSNFTPTAATVKGALEGIDSALASTADEKVGISAADTTPGYLAAKIQVDVGTNATDALEESILSPGGDEVLRIRLDQSKIDHGALTGLADDDHAQYILVAGTRAFTGNQSMGGFKLTSLAAGSGAGDSVRYEQAILTSGANAFTAAQSMGGFKLTNLADPTANQDAVTVAYLSARLAGLKPKEAARVGSLVDVDIATELEDGDTLDGIVLATGDRVLLMGQTAPEDNGIYVVQASGAAVRSTDFDSLSPIDEVNGAWLPVQEGTSAGKTFVQYGTVATLGTDPINFEFWDPIAGLVGGDMITKSGSILSVDLATVSGLESSNPGNAAGQLRVKLEASNPSLRITGSNELAAKLDAAGAILSGASGLAVQVDGSTLEISSNALRIKDAGVTLAKLASLSVDETKLTASVAGDGLSGGAGSALSVNVDNSTIEINSDSLRVKDAGITLAKLASLSVDETKLTASVAGAGLTGGAGSALAVGAGFGIQSNANDIEVLHSPAAKKTVVVGEAIAADTSFLVRWAVTGETAGRVYKADKDASVSDKFYAVGILNGGAGGLTAGQSAVMTMLGTYDLAASDTPFGAGDVGKAVYLGAAGAFTVTPPSAADEADYRAGIVEATGKIWVGNMQINGVN